MGRKGVWGSQGNPPVAVLAANITQYGPTFRDYLMSAKGCHPIVMIGEHHLVQAELDAAEVDVGKAGYRGFWSAARGTGRGGAAGGTAVLVDTSMEAVHAAEQGSEASSHPAGDPQFTDVTPVVVRLGALEVMLVSIYLTDGEAFGGSNAAKLEAVALWTGMYRMPFIIAGDFNVPLEEMEVSPWLERIQGGW